MRVHIIFGPQGAGKTTYARTLAARHGGVVFSIDEWMAELYLADAPAPLDLAWIRERVARCRARIWATAADVVRSGGTVLLDIGLLSAEERAQALRMAHERGIGVELHYLQAPAVLRRQRVLARNANGATRSFEVSPQMFDFMESLFEPPGPDELARCRIVETVPS